MDAWETAVDSKEAKSFFRVDMLIFWNWTAGFFDR